MKELNELPNIGKELEKLLQQVGIDSAEELIEVGAKEAFIRIKMSDGTACISKLSALQGAVMGIRWHHLPDEVKADLKEFYKTLR